MIDREGKAETSEDFFAVFKKVPEKSRRKITKKVGINFKDNATVGIKSSKN